MTCPKTTSEDCLTLNVYTPIGFSESSKFPVMVYLPGGRFEQGGSGVSLYDGSYIANTSNTILVTLNYRFGVLGYLFSEKLGGMCRCFWALSLTLFLSGCLSTTDVCCSLY